MSNDSFVGDVVDKLKKQGLFDLFRKECLADVDTKPAYQNLQLRVTGEVSRYLSTVKWKQDMNKNQLRENLRRHLNDLPMLAVGIDRVVDQVVKPKIFKSLKPQIDQVVCEHLGLDYEQWLDGQNANSKKRSKFDALKPETTRNDTSNINKATTYAPTTTHTHLTTTTTMSTTMYTPMQTRSETSLSSLPTLTNEINFEPPPPPPSPPPLVQEDEGGDGDGSGVAGKVDEGSGRVEDRDVDKFESREESMIIDNYETYQDINTPDMIQEEIITDSPHLLTSPSLLQPPPQPPQPPLAQPPLPQLPQPPLPHHPRTSPLPPTPPPSSPPPSSPPPPPLPPQQPISPSSSAISPLPPSPPIPSPLDDDDDNDIPLPPPLPEDNVYMDNVEHYYTCDDVIENVVVESNNVEENVEEEYFVGYVAICQTSSNNNNNVKQRNKSHGTKNKSIRPSPLANEDVVDDEDIVVDDDDGPLSKFATSATPHNGHYKNIDDGNDYKNSSFTSEDDDNENCNIDNTTTTNEKDNNNNDDNDYSDDNSNCYDDVSSVHTSELSSFDDEYDDGGVDDQEKVRKLKNELKDARKRKKMEDRAEGTKTMKMMKRLETENIEYNQDSSNNIQDSYAYEESPITKAENDDYLRSHQNNSDENYDSNGYNPNNNICNNDNTSNTNNNDDDGDNGGMDSPYSDISDASSNSVVVVGVEPALKKHKDKNSNSGNKYNSRKRKHSYRSDSYDGESNTSSRRHSSKKKKKKAKKQKSKKKSTKYYSSDDEAEEEDDSNGSSGRKKSKYRYYTSIGECETTTSTAVTISKSLPILSISQNINNNDDGEYDENTDGNGENSNGKIFTLSSDGEDAMRKKSKKSVDEINFGEAARQAAAIRQLTKQPVVTAPPSVALWPQGFPGLLRPKKTISSHYLPTSVNSHPHPLPPYNPRHITPDYLSASSSSPAVYPHYPLGPDVRKLDLMKSDGTVERCQSNNSGRSFRVSADSSSSSIAGAAVYDSDSRHSLNENESLHKKIKHAHPSQKDVKWN